jgi:hypothetical protein
MEVLNLNFELSNLEFQKNNEYQILNIQRTAIEIRMSNETAVISVLDIYVLEFFFDILVFEIHRKKMPLNRTALSLVSRFQILSHCLLVTAIFF